MSRVQLLNRLAKEMKYGSYLEIGCRTNTTFHSVKVPQKTGVDPQSGGTHRMTSDDFFRLHRKERFDLVFVDGLHERGQVMRDICHSLKRLDRRGAIVVHDCLPAREEHQLSPVEFRERFGADPPAGRLWNGDVWKAIAEIKTWNWPDLAVWDADTGLGLVVPRPNRSRARIPLESLKWENFAEIRPLLGILSSVEEAVEFVKGSSMLDVLTRS